VAHEEPVLFVVVGDRGMVIARDAGVAEIQAPIMNDVPRPGPSTITSQPAGNRPFAAGAARSAANTSSFTPPAWNPMIRVFTRAAAVAAGLLFRS
jgi:hypothetical protein